MIIDDDPDDGAPTALTGVVMPPVSARQRDALLTLKARVEQTTAALDIAAEAHRGMGRAVQGLLAAITDLLKVQDQDAQGDDDTLVATADFDPRPPELSVQELLRLDRVENPRGHPCRNCGRYFDEHRPNRDGDGDMHCEEWH